MDYSLQDGAIADHAARCAALHLLVAAHGSAAFHTNPFLSYLIEVRRVNVGDNSDNLVLLNCSCPRVPAVQAAQP